MPRLSLLIPAFRPGLAPGRHQTRVDCAALSLALAFLPFRPAFALGRRQARGDRAALPLALTFQPFRPGLTPGCQSKNYFRVVIVRRCLLPSAFLPFGPPRYPRFFHIRFAHFFNMLFWHLLRMRLLYLPVMPVSHLHAIIIFAFPFCVLVSRVFLAGLFGVLFSMPDGL